MTNNVCGSKRTKHKLLLTVNRGFKPNFVNLHR